MKLTQLLAASVLTVSSVCAFATPVYTGDTDASNITGSQMNTGYYLWNDDANANNWHIRWTSTNAAPGNIVDWFGSIVFEGGGLVSSSTFLFENGGTYGDQISVDTGLFSDEIEWLAVTNDTGGVDGIDFSIDNSLEILEFNLGSSLFSNLQEFSTGNGTTGSNIFIGDTFATPDVFVFNSRQGVYQSFEVSVAEPTSLALLGLGLAGLGFARRKQAKA